MSPTIKDVAKLAGVSLSTVSLVINGKKHVSTSTTQKVQAAIGELNYHPRHQARGLASKKSGNIGFILTNDHFNRAEPFYTKIFLGSELEARNHNFYILLTTVENKFTKKSIPRFMLEKNVDGVILAGKVPNNLVKYVQHLDLPILFIDYLPPNGKFPAILINNMDGATQAVTHLIEKGHRKIAFIGGDMTHPSIKERFEGYKKTLSDYDIPFDDKLVVIDEPYTDNKHGYSAAVKLLKQSRSFTALFAANDAMAFGCMRCLKENNIKIPDQVALVGFDDVDLAIQVEPRLTTLKVDKEEMGLIAVKNIVDMILTNQKSSRKILVPVELIVRQTT